MQNKEQNRTTGVSKAIKVGLFQFEPVFGEIRQNVEHVTDSLANIKADLIVLPELCTTGYQFKSPNEVKFLSEDISSSHAVNEFVKLCKDRNMYMVFGMAEGANGAFFNSALYTGPEGVIGVYKKAHLFFEEKFFFSPGNGGFPIFQQNGVYVGLMICFDWIFPEVARILALKGADIICHPANLVLPYCQQAMITRSIENGVFSLTANRIGEEKRGGKDALKFSGKSQVVDPRGNVLFRLGEEETVKVVEIDPAEARDKKITRHNDLMEDRLPELYGKLTKVSV